MKFFTLISSVGLYLVSLSIGMMFVAVDTVEAEERLPDDFRSIAVSDGDDEHTEYIRTYDDMPYAGYEGLLISGGDFYVTSISVSEPVVDSTSELPDETVLDTSESDEVEPVVETEPAVVSETTEPVTVAVTESEAPVITEPVTEPVAAVPVVVEDDYAVEDGLVFDVLDVTRPSNITREQLEYFISARCPRWIGLEDYILSFDDRINIVFLLAVARGETGAGANVVGSYNCFNVRSSRTGAYLNYSSYTESIDSFVNLILNSYCAEDGIYHEVYVDSNGVPHGSAIMGISRHYASEAWGHGIIRLGREIYDMLVDI